MIIIKKEKSRRLYDSVAKKYITENVILNYFNEGLEFKVVDSENKNITENIVSSITAKALAKIMIKETKKVQFLVKHDYLSKKIVSIVNNGLQSNSLDLVKRQLLLCSDFLKSQENYPPSLFDELKLLVNHYDKLFFQSLKMYEITPELNKELNNLLLNCSLIWNHYKSDDSPSTSFNFKDSEVRSKFITSNPFKIEQNLINLVYFAKRGIEAFGSDKSLSTIDDKIQWLESNVLNDSYIRNRPILLMAKMEAKRNNL